MSLVTKNCAGCDSYSFTRILDLGDVPLADAFPLVPGWSQRRFPLGLEICDVCNLIRQIGDVPGDLLFGSDYAFFTGSSPALVKHFSEYATWVHQKFPDEVEQGVLEIACNDGTLLQHFQNVMHVGIDPAGPPTTVARRKGLHVKTEPFTTATASKLFNFGVVIANNVLAHVEDPMDFLTGIERVLSPNGVVIIEFQSALALVMDAAFDMVYHEHRHHFTLRTLKQMANSVGFAVQDARQVDTQGGSIRVVLKRQEETSAITARARYLLIQEDRMTATSELLLSLQERVRYQATAIGRLVMNELAQGRRVFGYGASAKATQILHYCGLTDAEVEAVVDTTAYKIGRYMPGTAIPVIGPDDDPAIFTKTYLLLVRNYLSAVVRREARKLDVGVRFIVPAPHPFII
jgi:novobiocin biosynthesis protein NovU/D-mycarose 3-C-methyltransferase